MAIVIEAITTALGLKKLEEGKALIRAQMAKVPIKINRNIVDPLIKKKLILRRLDGFCELTPKGRKVKIKFHSIPLTIDQYFEARQDMDGFVQKKTLRAHPIYKVTITVCLACGKEADRLEPITDTEGFTGVYCKKCLIEKGYKKAREEVQRRIDNVNNW